MQSETHSEWLERRWPSTQRQITRLFMNRSEAALEALDGDEQHWAALTNMLAEDADRKRQTARTGLSGMWDLILSLLGDLSELIAMLKSSRSFILDAEAPEAALYTVLSRRAVGRLKMGFEPGKAHRAKVWSRLDRISRDLVIELLNDPVGEHRERNGIDRCTQKHFKMVAERIRMHFPSDRNLPRTEATVREYFHGFCGDCASSQETEDYSLADFQADSEQVESEAYDSSGLPQSERMIAFMEECMEQLSSEHKDALWASVGGGKNTRADMMDRLGLGRKAFASLIEKLQADVGKCLEEKARLLGAGPEIAVLRWE